ncbi:hypothetical protein CVIRNUC_007599 [Coccomyxa viridis]|uniref:Uncharacterized protein n=1 Tax=Coccomyxa viridis TaxID=1274662 RepID=A0AAV1IDR7_9CHLO|nr:hypothetical protein CVIRNUC_007599 [Coccomyxa viridis]
MLNVLIQYLSRRSLPLCRNLDGCGNLRTDVHGIHTAQRVCRKDLQKSSPAQLPKPNANAPAPSGHQAILSAPAAQCYSRRPATSAASEKGKALATVSRQTGHALQDLLSSQFLLTDQRQIQAAVVANLTRLLSEERPAQPLQPEHEPASAAAVKRTRGRPRKPLRTAEEPVTEVDACPQPACSVSQAGLAEQPARSCAAPVKRPRGRPKKNSVEAEQPNSPRKPRAGRPSAQDEDSPEDVMGAEDMSPEARSFRYGIKQREAYKLQVSKARGLPPQQDFTAYHAALRAEEQAARAKQDDARPPHPQDALQVVAVVVAGVLGRDSQAVLARLQASAYGLQQNPANLPSKDQAVAAAHEMLQLYSPLEAADAAAIVLDRALAREATLLSCSVEGMRSAVSFLEMLDMAPRQIAVCLAKAPQLLKENLEEKLLPLCEYLNSIGLDLPKQRLIVTWKPHILVTPLNKVKGQCAFLAGHGIQGETLAKALHKCRGLILVPREYLAQRLGYLYNELGCTAKDISRCVGLLGIRAEMLAMRVALLRHLGRQIQLPSQVPGDEQEWRESLRRNKEAGSFAENEPFPLWLAVAKSHNRLCKLLRCSKQEAWQFMQAWEKSAEGQRWMDAAADRPKKASTGDPMNVASIER